MQIRFPLKTKLIIVWHIINQRERERERVCVSVEGIRTMKAEKSPIQTVMSWIRRQPPKVKAFFAVVTAMTVLVFLKVIVHEHDNLFIASEAVHALGISLLIYKLTKEKTCAGYITFHFWDALVLL